MEVSMAIWKDSVAGGFLGAFTGCRPSGRGPGPPFHSDVTVLHVVDPEQPEFGTFERGGVKDVRA